MSKRHNNNLKLQVQDIAIQTLASARERSIVVVEFQVIVESVAGLA
ncbi:hypothetical protein [Photobacterium sanctipauli]|nr:hypothetical protein [Photobacterium sanctipauli]